MSQKSTTLDASRNVGLKPSADRKADHVLKRISRFASSGIWASLEKNAAKVLFVYISHADYLTGIAWPGVETVARESGIGIENLSRVRKAIRSLEHRGVLRLVERGGGRKKPSRYEVCAPPLAEHEETNNETGSVSDPVSCGKTGSASDPLSANETGSASALNRVTECAETGSASDPRTTQGTTQITTHPSGGGVLARLLAEGVKRPNAEKLMKEHDEKTIDRYIDMALARKKRGEIQAHQVPGAIFKSITQGWDTAEIDKAGKSATATQTNERNNLMERVERFQRFSTSRGLEAAVEDHFKAVKADEGRLQKVKDWVRNHVRDSFRIRLDDRLEHPDVKLTPEDLMIYAIRCNQVDQDEATRRAA